MGPAHSSIPNPNIWLSRFSKLTCFSTLFLIFAGGMVTSTGSGLSVPDWPLSYGMFFPPMVGGVFYEHGHRMVASVVGLFTLILAIWLSRVEKRIWVRNLGFAALGAVMVQGILGGITVKFFLPTLVSVAHGVLAQTFFIITIIIAYSQSKERHLRNLALEQGPKNCFVIWCLIVASVVFIQLIIGAIMRHTHSGLAIPDFPTMGGGIIPGFDAGMLTFINDWRFNENLDPVSMGQIKIHFLHRVWALVVLGSVLILTWKVNKSHPASRNLKASVYILDSLILGQIILGVVTVLSVKAPIVTSFHVVTGAAVLGMCVLLTLRAAPLSFAQFKEQLSC